LKTARPAINQSLILNIVQWYLG